MKQRQTCLSVRFIYINREPISNKGGKLLGLWLLCSCCIHTLEYEKLLSRKKMTPDILVFMLLGSSLPIMTRGVPQTVSCGMQKTFPTWEWFQVSFFYSGILWCRVMDDTRSDTALDQHPELHETLGYAWLFLSSLFAFVPFRALCHSPTISLTKSTLGPPGHQSRAEGRREGGTDERKIDSRASHIAEGKKEGWMKKSKMDWDWEFGMRNWLKVKGEDVTNAKAIWMGKRW